MSKNYKQRGGRGSSFKDWARSTSCYRKLPNCGYVPTGHFATKLKKKWFSRNQLLINEIARLMKRNSNTSITTTGANIKPKTKKREIAKFRNNTTKKKGKLRNCETIKRTIITIQTNNYYYHLMIDHVQKYMFWQIEVKITKELQIMIKKPKKKKKCAKCGKRRKLKICEACRNIKYCSRKCQKKDWKQHKQHCNVNF